MNKVKKCYLISFEFVIFFYIFLYLNAFSSQVVNIVLKWPQPPSSLKYITLQPYNSINWAIHVLLDLLSNIMYQIYLSFLVLYEGKMILDNYVVCLSSPSINVCLFYPLHAILPFLSIIHIFILLFLCMFIPPFLLHFLPMFTLNVCESENLCSYF